MRYISTRDDTLNYSASQCVVRGIAPDGGLLLPYMLPQLSQDFFASLAPLDYPARAAKVLAEFFGEFSETELISLCTQAYSGHFDDDIPAPMTQLSGDTYMLELWHGPTCAFKDLALQLLPRLMTACAKKLSFEKKLVVLTATSGDTGKAALEGFRDVPNTQIAVFYPRDGVSEMQKIQMTTQQGGNVAVCGVLGNFDDAQTAVKELFGDAVWREELSLRGAALTSANSINWGRLAPQIAYYISAYSELLANEKLLPGEKLNICVPTGNFGNILAARYAAEMGVPVGKLICASNSNNVLADFFATGRYDRRREFFTTISPSMDILISSNLERMLFELEGRDTELIRKQMAKLKAEGEFCVSAGAKAKMDEIFWAGWCSDEDAKGTIARAFSEYSYLCDTHTAVALNVLGQYRRATGDATKTIVASTASPFKFAGPVLEALGEDTSARGDFALLDMLSELSGMPVPQPLADLRLLPMRFDDALPTNELKRFVTDFIG